LCVHSHAHTTVCELHRDDNSIPEMQSHELS